MHPHDVLHPTPVRDLKRTLTDLHKMSQQESQYVESLVPRSNSNKAPNTLDVAYIDTLYNHDIVMDLLGRKIPKELTS